MLSWLLSLFPQYRTLLREVSDMTTERDQEQRRREYAEIERDGWKEQAYWLREQMVAAHNEAKMAVMTVANVEYQRRYGWTPYPTAPGLPDNALQAEAEHPTVAKPSLMAFQARRQAGLRFVQQAKEQYEQAHPNPIEVIS